MISKFRFLLGEGVRSLWRAKLPAMGSSLTIALTVFIFGIAFVVLHDFGKATRRLQNQYRIDVFFDPLLSYDSSYDVFLTIRRYDGVGSAEFINKDRAAKIFKDEFGESVEEVLGINPLPPGAVILVGKGYRTVQRINSLADKLSKTTGVTDVSYRGEVVRVLERYLQYAVYGGLIVGLVALLSAVFLVSNTIKLSIYAKRDNIDILNLLGATKNFIRFPFLVEGALQGLLGSGLALLVVFGFLDFVNYLLEQFVLYRVIAPPYLSVSLVVLGFMLGVIGSYRSIRIFLARAL